MTVIMIFAILTILISNYISFIYGVRIGKAMQKDIPPVPIEPIINAAKRAIKLIKDWPVKKYFQKKPFKQDEDDYSPWNM